MLRTGGPSTLQLKWKRWQDQHYYYEVLYLDYVVNRVSLADLLQRATGYRGPDHGTQLSYASLLPPRHKYLLPESESLLRELNAIHLSLLLGEGGEWLMDSGRVPLYFYAWAGDFYDYSYECTCARITRQGDEMIWSDFLCEADTYVEEPNSERRYDVYSGSAWNDIGPFTFKLSEYNVAGAVRGRPPASPAASRS